MRISDAMVEVIKNESFYYFINKKNPIIIPKLDHHLCQNVLKLAGKKTSKGVGGNKRELECNRVAQALENDDRFEKFIHITGCRAYRYIGL